MKKEFKPPYWIGLIFFVITAFGNIGKATDFFEKIGFQNAGKVLDIIMDILNVILPIILIWFLWIIKKGIDKIDQQNISEEGYRKNVHDDLVFNRTQISELWEQKNSLQRQVDNINELVKLMIESSSTTTRTVVSLLNNLKSENEINAIVNALYDKCKIPELEKIGVGDTIIARLKIKYHFDEINKNL